MHSNACAVGGTQQAATDDTIAWPLRGDWLRRWENQRMLSSFHFNFIFILPSVLRRCWLGVWKSIRPVQNRVMCQHGYLSGARCKFAYGHADATATPLSLASLTLSCVTDFHNTLVLEGASEFTAYKLPCYL